MLKAKSAQVDQMQARNDAFKSSDMNQRAKDLFRDNQAKNQEVEKLLKALPYLIPFIKLSTWMKMLFKPKSA